MKPPKIQRWIDLLAALLRRHYPVTFDQLIDQVPAYTAEQKPESRRRTFERDKLELRKFGVPIEARSRTLGLEPDRPRSRQLGGNRRGESLPGSGVVGLAFGTVGTRPADGEGVALHGVTGVRRRKSERTSVRSSMRSLPKSLTR